MPTTYVVDYQSGRFQKHIFYSIASGHLHHSRVVKISQSPDPYKQPLPVLIKQAHPYTLEYRSLSHAVMMWDHLLYYEAYVLYSISDPTQIFPQDEHQHIAVHFLFDRILT